MKKRFFSMLLCLCMLLSMLNVSVFAADAIKAGEKAVTVSFVKVYEAPDKYGSKSTDTLWKGIEVDVLEAYISGKGGTDNKWHKISYTMPIVNRPGTGYIEALEYSGLDTLKPLGAVEPETVSASVLVDAPAAGAKPNSNIRLGDTANMTVESYKWSGAYDNSGCFVAGNKNTLTVKISLTAENMVFSGKRADYTINGMTPFVMLSNQNRTVELSYTFEVPKDAAEIPAGNTDKFAPGDYGTMRLLRGGYSLYHEPDSRTMYGASQNTDAVIVVLEAGVAGIDSDALYYAVWNERLDEVDYVNMNDAKATFGSFTKEGNDPARPYNAMFAAKRNQSHEITEIDVDFLYATAVSKPYMCNFHTEQPITAFVDRDTYACTGVVIDTTEIPEPYSIVSATATYVAKGSYHFARDVQPAEDVKYKTIRIDGKTTRLANTYSVNYIDEKTIELVYYEYIDPEPFDTTITAAMEEYYARHWTERGNSMPVIGSSKLKDEMVGHDPQLYNHPTKHAMPAFEIQPNQIIEIIDWDLTDVIPDITGEWCRVRIGSGIGFVPKSYLTDVVFSDFWVGAPAVERDSRYEFAGGSGTKDDPYLIETPDQLNAIRKNSNKYFKLIKDIDLSDWGNWIPIGGTPAYGGNGDDKFNSAQFGAYYFGGHIDGDGHVISGMTIKIDETMPYMQGEGSSRYFGLIGVMSNGLEEGEGGISNLGLINFTIDVTYSGYTKPLYIWAGAFAATMLNSTIENCYTANGKINFNLTKGVNAPDRLAQQIMIGGFTSDLARSTVTNCRSDADITVTGDEMSYLIAGGFAANLMDSDITSCYSAGDITLPIFEAAGGNRSIACGIFAISELADVAMRAEYSYVTDCYNTGNLTANHVAGLAYLARTRCYCTFTNCYSIGALNIDETALIMGELGKTPFVYQAGGLQTVDCYADGNSVSGSAWKYSAALGRKVLAAIPEDTFTIPAVDAVGSAPKAEIVGTFVDVPVEAWFAEPVKWAVENGVTNGTSATTFSPGITCSKAQIITFIWRAMGEPSYTIYNSPFTDVNYKDYYFVSSWWAYEMGMVESGAFEANQLVTRADTVVYLWKNAGSPDVGTVDTFTDVPADAPYAKAVAWAVQNGITLGTSATTFSPDDTCTRAQIVTFLQRAVK